MYDLIIIGTGPGGLTAGIYAGRRNLKTLIIGEVLGGQMSLAHRVENYPGFDSINGLELAEKMAKQAKDFDCEIKAEKVIDMELKGDIKKVKTDERKYEAKTVIIASGGQHRKLNVEGEDKFMGKGVSYCATCLPPNEVVMANTEPKSIANITNGSRVLTLDGNYKDVTQVMSRNYIGNLIEIKTRFFGEPVLLTPEHPVLKLNVIRGKGGNYWRDFRFTKESWVNAADLKTGDIVIYPIIKETRDIKSIKLSDFLDIKKDRNLVRNIKETYTSHKVKDRIAVNKDFLRLVGYYLADGTITSRGINFYFDSHEKDYAKDVSSIIKKIFGLNTTVKKEGSVTRVMVFSNILRDFFKLLFRKYSYNKKLPHFMMLLPPEKQKEIIKGIWRGDGCRREKDFTIVTNSNILTYQIRDILLRLAIIPSIQVRKVKDLNKKPSKIDGRKIFFRHDKYNIVFGGPFLKKASNILNVIHERLKEKKRDCYHAWIKNGFVLLPVRSIKRVQYNGIVYNLAVAENDTYVAKNFVVHNCDGPMFKGKRVAIIGGSDCAIISALYLVQICKEVYLIHRRNEFRAEEANQEKLRKSKIKLIMNSVVEKIEGNKTIENLKIKNVETNEISDLKVGGVFVEIGQIPTSQIAKKAGVNVDENGFIKVNSKQETNLKGVYAAGDITGGFAQIITAVGQGAVATMSAYLCIHGPAYTGRVDWGEKKRKTCS